jgi:hypothetical protein
MNQGESVNHGGTEAQRVLQFFSETAKVSTSGRSFSVVDVPIR